MPTATERVWTATPRQREFLRATDDEVLYGGAAGGGKTDALLILAAMRCTEHPGAHVLYLRRTFPDLELSAIKRSLELFSGTGPRYNAGAHRWTWPGGSRLQFGHLQHETDVYDYQSAEFDLLLFDELTQFTEAQYTYMLSRNRTSKPGIRPWTRAATNPGGEGHAWVRRRFVDAAPAGTTFVDPETGRTRRFVPAMVRDNPYLLEADPGYVARLGELPDAKRRALLDGDWDVFEGAAFPEWRAGIHTCRPFDVPETWLRFTSTDWGMNDECATLWWAVDPDSRLHVYRERVVRGVGSRDTARAILDMGRDERIAYNAIGDDVDVRKDAEPTIGELMRQEGFAYRPIPRAPGSRISSKQLLHDWLRVEETDGRKWARLTVFDSCRRTVTEVPNLIYDERRPEDVVHSDIYDALRYGVMSRPRPARVSVAPPGPGTLGHLRRQLRRQRMGEAEGQWRARL